MKNIFGSLIAVILAFFMLGVAPMYYIGIIQWQNSQSQALAYTRNVVDEVIDTKVLSDDVLDDYSINMASLSNSYNFTIYRKVKITNPDPVNAGQTYSTYVTVDDNRTYDQGDLIVIEVTPTGKNVAQSFAQSLLGLRSPSAGFTLPGRVR